MEQPEADEVLFKMEGRQNVVLFKRPDGKFLTSNCPVGVRWKQTVLVASVVAVLMVVGCILILGSLPPPPARDTTANEQPSPAQETETKGAWGAGSDGWVHVSPGSTAPAQPAVYASSHIIPAQPSARGPYPAGIPPPGALAPSASGMPAIPAPAPEMPAQMPATGLAGQQMPAAAPAVQAVPGQSAVPTSAPATVQTPGPAPATLPSEQTAVPAQSSEGSASTPQTTSQPGVWQRPGR